jgi:hypothetical protein
VAGTQNAGACGGAPGAGSTTPAGSTTAAGTTTPAGGSGEGSGQGSGDTAPAGAEGPAAVVSNAAVLPQEAESLPLPPATGALMGGRDAVSPLVLALLLLGGLAGVLLAIRRFRAPSC